MKVCILGNGLTSLTLAKALANEGINVIIFSDKKLEKQNKSRTVAISKDNLEYFNKNILDISKLAWSVDKIEVFSEVLKNEKILSFEKKNSQIFSIIRNYKLYNLLFSKLKKNKLVTFENYKNGLYKKNYNLIIVCDRNHSISKKFFFRNIKKDYKSFAYTTLMNHQKLKKNNVATQYFTRIGPLAFLPISQTQTSIVFSAKGKNHQNLSETINKFNEKYKSIKLDRIYKFELKSSSLRSYYKKNVLAFGELLHKIHPHAGQGFNMSLRDIKDLIFLAKSRIELGLELDSSVCSNFEMRNKHLNYLFASGVDFVYEFFNLENKINYPIMTKTLKLFGQNKLINDFLKKSADQGLRT